MGEEWRDFYNCKLKDHTKPALLGKRPQMYQIELGTMQSRKILRSVCLSFLIRQVFGWLRLRMLEENGRKSSRL